MMDTPQADLSFAMPSNKFYPPHIDESQSLLREQLIASKFPTKVNAKKAVVVEAQAGQGKTTLISQFLQYNGLNYIWYQIGPEDSDPVLLLSSLLANLSLQLPDFSSPQLSSILKEGEVGPLDLKRCALILLHDLDSYLTHNLYIVFDDLHLIAGTPLTNNLLEFLLDTSPPRLRFVLASRHPLEIKSKVLRDGNKISYLSTEDLALDEKEIEDLYNSVLQESITRQDAIDIHRMTNGWIMGIVLASHPISGRSRFWHDSSSGGSYLPPSGHGHMLDYFQDEIFDKIPKSLHLPFLKLSFISEIPVDLATLLTGTKEFGNILSDMARDNFFVYRLDDNKSVFRFHHFFQEFLQLQAHRDLSDTEIQHLYTTEAEYYLERDMVEKALASYKNAEDYLTMERLLQDRGMELIARNRTLTILALLTTIPEETLFQHSWLTLYAGLLRNDFAPKSTLIYYQKAIAIFIEKDDETGELIALSQMIYFHFVISGQYNVGSTLLARAEFLLKKNQENLPDHVKILAARNLASGLCFFNGEMERARKWIGIASTLAGKQKSRNFISASRFIQGYIELLSGNRAKYLRDAEVCYSLLNDPLVGMSNKLTIRVMYLCYLSMVGDFLNFNIQQQAITEEIDKAVVDQTVAAPYLFVWGASCYFSLGQNEKAMGLLDKGLSISSTASSAHMHSQLLQWQAYGSALVGEKEITDNLISRSAELREEAGGRFYESFNQILAGGAYTRIGDFEKGYPLLESGLETAREISSTYLTICGLMQSAYHKMIARESEAALDDLESGLSLMKNNGYSHFWGWEPKMMGQLLSLATRFDIEKSFARMLARQRLGLSFSDHGEPIPLLSINVLDHFQISWRNNIICRAKDLTPSQRELIGLLITAKGQRISQERVQLELWPDNSPDNARKSFDTLLTRLRKELSKRAEMHVKDHIFMQKGILCLSNYQMDSLRFSEAARTGLVHSKNSDWWQAGNAFQQALYYWKGTLPEETFKNEQALNHNDDLVNTLVEFTTSWTKQMWSAGRISEAINLIERVLQITFLDEQLVTLLYALHMKNNAPIRAKEVLEKYRTALLNVDYDQEEITEYVEDVISSARAFA